MAVVTLMANDEAAMTEIAETNLNLACGLPGAETLDVPFYLRKLGVWARLSRLRPSAVADLRRSPSDFEFSCQIRNADSGHRSATQSGSPLRPRARRELLCSRSAHPVHSRSLDGHGGTCVTMPILYIAIGRRLGYPLYLVQAREHFFVRWEEPGTPAIQYRSDHAGLYAPRRRTFLSLAQADTRRRDPPGLFLRNLTPGRR